MSTSGSNRAIFAALFATTACSGGFGGAASPSAAAPSTAPSTAAEVTPAPSPSENAEPVTLTYLGALAPVSNGLLGTLERQYPPLPSSLPAVRYIVVLGSGYAPRDGIPVTAALDPDGLVEIVKAAAAL